MKKKLIQLIVIIKRNPYTTGLIIVAAILHLIIILPSGSHYCFNGYCGDFFWGVHEHDGIWHIAVAETAFTGRTPINPSFSGTSLSGYNILLDYVIFLLSRLGFSSFFVYFKLFPIIWFGLFTYSAIRFIRVFSKGKLALFIFLLLSYFGTSFGFVIPLIKNHTFEGGGSISIMQPILTLTNLQLAFSYITLMWIIIIMREFKKSIVKVALISLLLFLSWGLKFYAGSLVSITIGIYYLICAIKEKKYSYLLWNVIFILISIAAIVFIYNPFVSNRPFEATFSFHPLAIVWPFIEDNKSIFYSSYWANAKYIYLNSPKISPRFLVFELALAVSYLLLSFGMRTLGFFYILKNKLKTIDIGIYVGIVVGVLAALLLVQKGVWWNVVQFLYISSFLLSIYTSLYISKIKNNILKYILVILIAVTSIPYIFDSLKPYISTGYNYVSDNEKNALLFLRKSKPGVVYNPLYKKIESNKGVTDLRLAADNSYISAYTGKQMYLQVTGAILLSNDYKLREEKIKKGDCTITEQINYVYFHKDSIDLFIRKCILKNNIFLRKYSGGGYSIYSKKS